MYVYLFALGCLSGCSIWIESLALFLPLYWGAALYLFNKELTRNIFVASFVLWLGFNLVVFAPLVHTFSLDLKIHLPQSLGLYLLYCSIHCISFACLLGIAFTLIRAFNIRGIIKIFILIPIFLLWEWIDPQVIPVRPYHGLAFSTNFIEIASILKLSGWTLCFYSLSLLCAFGLILRESNDRRWIVLILASTTLLPAGKYAHYLMAEPNNIQLTANVIIIQDNPTKDSSGTIASSQLSLYGLSFNENRNFLSKIQNFQSNIDSSWTNIILWPEGALENFILSAPKTLKYLRQLAQLIPGHHFIGVSEINFSENRKTLYNSLVYVDNNSEKLEIYRKNLLVPVFENLDQYPIMKPYLVEMLPNTIVDGLLSPGKTALNFFIPELNLVLVPVICFEAIQLKYLHDRIASAKRQNPSAHVAILAPSSDSSFNDFGKSLHLKLAQFNAARLGVPLLRASSTGISVVTNSFGKIVMHIPSNLEHVSSAELFTTKINSQ